MSHKIKFDQQISINKLLLYIIAQIISQNLNKNIM